MNDSAQYLIDRLREHFPGHNEQWYKLLGAATLQQYAVVQNLLPLSPKERNEDMKAIAAQYLVTVPAIRVLSALVPNAVKLAPVFHTLAEETIAREEAAENSMNNAIDGLRREVERGQED